jgi:hypothetical protein
MVPVIDAIAAAANATAIRKPNRQKAKPSESSEHFAPAPGKRDWNG